MLERIVHTLLIIGFIGGIIFAGINARNTKQAEALNTVKPATSQSQKAAQSAPARKPATTQTSQTAQPRQAPAPKPEPAWKSTVRDVSVFLQNLDENRLRQEHTKINVTEDSLRVHEDASRFSIGLSRSVELEAMSQQRVHIVQLCDRIIATFRELDTRHAQVEQRVRSVSWDSAAERNNQLARLGEYENLKRQYLQPALAMKSKYDR